MISTFFKSKREVSEEILVEVELNECTLRRDENAIGGKWKEETEGMYIQAEWKKG